MYKKVNAQQFRKALNQLRKEYCFKCGGSRVKGKVAPCLCGQKNCTRSH